MALWLKQEDGTLVEVSGGGGGGSFDGEHVLTGDPDSPPEGWAVGQLLYDGLEDAADSSGPHDHDEYALVEHDHDDYLPLEGGTLTGGLQVDGTTTISGSADFKLSASDTAKVGKLRVDNGATLELYGETDANYANRIIVRGSLLDLDPGCKLLVRGNADVKGDLTVDGKITNAEVNANTDELSKRGIIGAKRGSATDKKCSGLAVAASRALTLNAGRRFRISGTVNIGKHTAADGYTDGYVNVALWIDNSALIQQSVYMRVSEMTSVHLEWTGHALTGASGGSWQGVSLTADANAWQYVGTYERRATLIIEDVGPYVDLNDYGRTTTELEHPEALDLDQVKELSAAIKELKKGA